MIVGDKSMVALTSVKSKNSNHQEVKIEPKYEKDLIDLRAKFENILKQQPEDIEIKDQEKDLAILR